MRRPVTKQADLAHEIAHRAVLMVRDKIPHAVVEIKCRCDRYRSDSDADQPIERSGTLHKQVLIAVIPSGVEAATQRTKPARPGFQFPRRNPTFSLALLPLPLVIGGNDDR